MLSTALLYIAVQSLVLADDEGGQLLGPAWLQNKVQKGRSRILAGAAHSHQALAIPEITASALRQGALARRGSRGSRLGGCVI